VRLGDGFGVRVAWCVGDGDAEVVVAIGVVGSASAGPEPLGSPAWLRTSSRTMTTTTAPTARIGGTSRRADSPAGGAARWLVGLSGSDLDAEPTR
jgi:hypothetical protein